MTRVLVIGAGGMLGQDLMDVLSPVNLQGLTRADLDTTDQSAVLEACGGFDVLVNTAAYTAVDDAESNEAVAFSVNAEGARNVALAAKAHQARLIHLSTDYVFDGEATTPYPVDAPTNPLSVYGASKLAGEQAITDAYPEGSIIARTSWLYGQHGSSFPRTILQAGLSLDHLDVVRDQMGQPTWTRDVAHMISALIASPVDHGIFHATNSGQASWFEFARKLFRLAGWDDKRIAPTTASEFPRPAPRPSWSVLDHSEWQAHRLPPPRNWEEALEDAWESGLSSFAASDSAL